MRLLAIDIEDALLLHRLATDPASIVPEGKSLLSMLNAPAAQPAQNALHAQVQSALHSAFWQQALAALHSPQPAVQLPRLKLLYTDLHDALVPLFPQHHPVLLTLAAPLPPTSSPLHSTLAFLKDILHALRQRCAPIRDSLIDAILANLDRQTDLPPLIISAIRDIVSLADTLKRDLTNSLFATISDAHLAHLIRTRARDRERDIILHHDMWRSLQIISQLWSTWSNHPLWTSRLLRALTSSTPVTCHPTDPHPNSLPPQLFFVQPKLLYLQNYLQALVVAASLKSLVRLPPTTAPNDFMSRVWSLLKSEVDRDEHAHAIDPDATKLVNLADEVIRAHTLFSSSPITQNDDKNLRAAVERTLRLQDPVFALLQGRLALAIDHELVERRNRSITNTDTAAIPETMRTGRSSTLGGVSSGSVTPPSSYKSAPIVVKGFEGEVLAHAIDDAVQKLWACIEWVEGVWADSISSPSNLSHDRQDSNGL